MYTMDRYEKIEILFDLEKYNDVIALCVENLYKVNSDKLTLFFYLVFSLIQTQEFKKASQFCDEARKEFPGSDIFVYLNSVIALHDDNFDDATQLINQALQMEPNNAIYYAHYCRILLKSNDFMSAKKMIDRALNLESTNLDYQFLNVVLLYKLDRKKDPEKILENILQKDPHHEGALYFKQTFFISKLNDKKQVLKGLLQTKPFDLDYQREINFIKFYYRYIPLLMLLSFALSYLVFDNRSVYGYLKPISMVLFYIVGIIGSQDRRFNLPFILIQLFIVTYLTNRGGMEISDGIGILFHSFFIFLWFLGTYHPFKHWILIFKQKSHKKKKNNQNRVVYFLVTYPFEKNGVIDPKALTTYYLSMAFLLPISLYLIFLYPVLQSIVPSIEALLIGLFCIIAIWSAKNPIITIHYIFLQ